MLLVSWVWMVPTLARGVGGSDKAAVGFFEGFTQQTE